MIKFRIWLEDIYGFEQKALPEPEDDDMPIKTFSFNRMMDELSRLQIGEMQIKRPFEDIIQWGESGGAIRVRLTPNQGVCIERHITDQSGSPFWITKNLMRVKAKEYAGQESAVVTEISEILLELAKESIDSTSQEYKNLPAIVSSMVNQVKRDVSEYFSFQEVKKVNDHNYNILLVAANSGVGKVAHGHRRPSMTPAGIIDVSYDKERGTLKGILTTVDVDYEGGDWVIDVPYFMGEFAPSQPVDEIVRVLTAGLKFI